MIESRNLLLQSIVLAIIISAVAGTGCTKRYIVAPPGTSQIRFQEPPPPASYLSIQDQRSDDAREDFSSGTLGACTASQTCTTWSSGDSSP